ncbi:hypothetical protein [Vibrio splendidus]|uniref:hypothetical protein n=1 Tax=Vibrio splendidus TaxID=29497 RepID=UPI000E09AA05|nr:hypothetical protein [Vibrio splendidus]
MSRISYPYSVSIVDTIKNNYESFRFETHELSHDGLYTDGERIYAVIQEVLGDDEKRAALESHYEEFRTVAIPPVVIVGGKLPGFIKIPLRDSFEKSHLFGQPLFMDEFINQLNIHIPKKYQPFHADMKWATNEFRIVLKNETTNDEKEDIQLICESLGHQGFDYVFEVNHDISDYPGVVDFKDDSKNNLQIIASGLIQKQFPRNVLDRYEEDEDFWVKNRNIIFNGDELEHQDIFLPNDFSGKNTKCFVDASVFERRNLRVYLSLYEKVVIALPFKSEERDFYSMFGINPLELKELIIRGRLLFVVPQNLARYSQTLLQEIIEVNPNAIIFSRRLAATTIQGIQKKSGIVGSTFSSDEQYAFLYYCARSNSEGLKLLAKSLSEQWQFSEYMIDKEGATSVFRAGFSNLATKLFEVKGKDLSIELATASSSFEFAQGLNAHHFPFDSEQYSEVAACEAVGCLYNGVINNSSFIRESEISILLENVLAINNDMNVLELDDALTSNSLRAIPDILKGYSNLSKDELSLKLYELRKELMQIEKNRGNLAALDCTGAFGPLVTGAIMEYNNVSGGAYVSLGGWLLTTLCHYSRQSSLADNPIFTRLSSMKHRVSQDAVIIKRCRDSIKKYS